MYKRQVDAVHLKEEFARVGTSRAGFALPARKNRPLAEPAPLYCFLLAEVALEQAFERLAVAGLVAGHSSKASIWRRNGVVDSLKAFSKCIKALRC